MNKVDPKCLEKVTGDAWKIIEQNGVTAEEVTKDEGTGFLKVVRGDLCLEWGTKPRPGSNYEQFELYVWQTDGWQVDVCIDEASWSGACNHNAPPTVLEYFQIYGVDNHNDGLDLAFESYEAGLVALDRLVWAFVNRQPEFERAIRAILDKHGIGTGQRIESPDAKGWQEERNSLFLNWGDLDGDQDFVVSVSKDRDIYGGHAALASVTLSRQTHRWSPARRQNPQNPFSSIMDNIADDDIDESYDGGETIFIARPAAGLELVDRLVSMFVNYQP